MDFLQVDIRPMTKSDLPSVMEIERLCFKAPYTEENILYEIEQNQYSNIWVVELNYQNQTCIAGFSIYWQLFDVASILQIAIHPTLQHRQLGTALMDEIINDCFAKKIRKISLEVRENNTKAIKFYEKNGFKKTQIKPHYYSNGDNAIIMEREVEINGNNFSN